jgi:phosphohistidine phosphatase
MKILLMRHGEAVDQAAGMSDGDRWLTAKGRRVSREVAAEVVAHTRPAAVWTSPLVRATQTAEILVHAAGLEGDVSVVREIATGEVDALVKRLREYEGEAPLALVGHEPTLSTLVMTLLGERRWNGFEKSSVCALSLKRGETHARFEWMFLAKKLKLVEDLHKLQG